MFIIIKHKNLYDALGINMDEKNIISFVGGGGKTTAIYTLAEEIKNYGKKVVIITTTHMYKPKFGGVYVKDIDIIKEELTKKRAITVGQIVSADKISYIGDEIVSELIKICDFILVEADGAKMLPIKAPSDHEPVILRGSNILIGIAGIDACGKELHKVCHRAEIAAKVLNISIDEEVSEKHMSFLLSNEKGQMKGIVKNNYSDIKYRVIINKVDNEKAFKRAMLIYRELKDKEIQCIITSLKNKKYYSNEGLLRG